MDADLPFVANRPFDEVVSAELKPPSGSPARGTGREWAITAIPWLRVTGWGSGGL